VNGRTVTGMLDPTGLDRSFTAFHNAEAQATTPVPYTATLDDEGRLAQLVIDLPAGGDPLRPAARWSLSIADYGKAAASEAPSEFEPVPELYYTPREDW
jgi:hypothetical protein